MPVRPSRRADPDHLLTVPSSRVTPIGRVFDALARPDLLSAVFHCHAGKDRTGFVAALLLEALRVPRESVLDDYVLTTEYRRREHQKESYQRLRASGMAAEAAARVLGAPRWAMAETLKQLDVEFGGIERYLIERAGLHEVTLDRLRRVLTSRPSETATRSRHPVL